MAREEDPKQTTPTRRPATTRMRVDGEAATVPEGAAAESNATPRLATAEATRTQQTAKATASPRVVNQLAEVGMVAKVETGTLAIGAIAAAPSPKMALAGPGYVDWSAMDTVQPAQGITTPNGSIADFGVVRANWIGVDDRYAPDVANLDWLNPAAEIDPRSGLTLRARDRSGQDVQPGWPGAAVASGVANALAAFTRYGIEVVSDKDKACAFLGQDRDKAVLQLGSPGAQGNLPGELLVRNEQGRASVSVRGANGTIALRRGTEGSSRLEFGPTEDTGHVHILDEHGTTTTYLGDFDGRASLYLGGAQGRYAGRIVLRRGNYQHQMILDAQERGIRMFNDGGASTAFFGHDAGKAGIWLGGTNHPGRIVLRKGNGQDQIVLDAETGDITLPNADCAEEFEVTGPTPEPGSVVVLSDEVGRLRLSDQAFDTRVAGIVSGAGNLKPGIVLGRTYSSKVRRPIALVGRVFCNVEADTAPIATGSLLTTSDVPGHAMAVEPQNHGKALGAILGKALAPLSGGKGSIPVLVALQ